MLRTLVAILAALLVGIQVVRSAAVQALSASHPEIAAKFWRAHPSVEISQGLIQIAVAARNRKTVDQRSFEMIYDAAGKSPVSADPFLVRGVQAQTAGNRAVAKEAFLEAQWRDPRSLGAAYFLANYYIGAGHTFEALKQTAILARIAPGGAGAVAPFVAVYAQTPSNWAAMRALFKSQADLEDPVLAILARSPSNANAILAIADTNHRKPDSSWVGTLIQSMIAAADYERARAIWSSVSRVNIGDGLLFDANFSAPASPAPFNWSLTTSGVGLAERQPGKRLHVIFYGNQDGVLATQLLLLKPGAYHLRLQVVGALVHPETLRWSIRCDKSQEAIADTDMAHAASNSFSFEVPAKCPAQWLELSGRSPDVAQQAEATIATLRLTHG